MSTEIFKVLIVDDEEVICSILSSLMQRNGYAVATANDGKSALKALLAESPDVLLLDYRMDGMDGLEVLKSVKAIDPDLPVVMVTGHAEVSGAVELMRAGAYDYLSKPFEHSTILRVVGKAISERQLKKQIKELSSQLENNLPLNKSMGPSKAVHQLIVEVNMVARSNLSVIILGETGSGKELVARAIHAASFSSAGPFVAIDCGAITPTLLESELFGYEKGAFTGAVSQKQGKFEAAENGTILLDEITNMSFEAQANLLRLLQEKKGYRVGGTKPVALNARILAACNRDLDTAIESGKFRDDLYYRLNEYIIRIPPLRERKEDIPCLADRFIKGTNIELGKNVRGISDSAMAALTAYDWPGNVRQLRSVVRRAVLLAEEVITEKMLNMEMLQSPITGTSLGASPEVVLHDTSLKEIVHQHVEALERSVLAQALNYTGWNKAKASRMLKVDYKTLHTKVKKYGIVQNGGRG